MTRSHGNHKSAAIIAPAAGRETGANAGSPVGANPPAAPDRSRRNRGCARAVYRASPTRHRLDENGNEVTKKDVYKEGVAGSSETHSKTTTGPSGTTTRSTTTHTPE
jgi:hypothetical protein